MKGKVYLIGAGPGDYELLTLKGKRLISEADVVVYDRLASSKYLNLAKEDAKLIYVGKKSSNHVMKQEEINSVLVEEAKKGNVVARLKGGDPYVFGRGGEECQELIKNKVEFEVVPGITSAIGGLCYGGIPITHRDYNSSFHVITGHFKDENKDHDWDAIVKLNGTIVFLMGVSNLEKITKNLIKYGMDKSTNIALVQWATRSYQKVAVGTLSTIVDEVKKKNISSPSIIVVGEVVKLQSQLNFFNPEKEDLFGKNIVVTRARAQSSNMVRKLEKLGARVIEVPTIKISEVNNCETNTFFESFKEHDAVVFTSSNSVDMFFKKLRRSDYDVRILSDKTIYSMGSGSSDELGKYMVKADYLPDRYISESLCEKIEDTLPNDSKIFIPRAMETRGYLTERLNKNYLVKEEVVYKNTIGDVSDTDLEFLNNLDIDYVTFTSSSTVKNYFKIIEKESIVESKKLKYVTIGPATSQTLESYGHFDYLQAEMYDIDGVIEKILFDSNK